jgi:hypothetical protein
MSEPQLPQSLLRVLASLTEWFKDQHVSYALILLPKLLLLLSQYEAYREVGCSNPLAPTINFKHLRLASSVAVFHLSRFFNQPT